MPEEPVPNEHFTDDATAVADLLRPALLRLNRDLRREIRTAAGLSPFQTLILGTLQQEPGIGVNELAARERIRPPSMSAHIKMLEQAGFLERITGAHADRRRVGLRITPEGARKLGEVKRLRTAWLAGRIALLSQGERESIRRAIDPLIKLSEPPTS
ncbi:MarR family winged helix-turn-helix transcriptional regulator [Pseudochelatococcus sp. B33]